MKELNFKLTVSEVNMILEALGHRSYIKVYELIDKIQSQAKTQLNGSGSSLSLSQEDNHKEPKAAGELSSN